MAKKNTEKFIRQIQHHFVQMMLLSTSRVEELVLKLFQLCWLTGMDPHSAKTACMQEEKIKFSFL